jgi:hypothetical protein
MIVGASTAAGLIGRGQSRLFDNRDGAAMGTPVQAGLGLRPECWLRRAHRDFNEFLVDISGCFPNSPV